MIKKVNKTKIKKYYQHCLVTKLLLTSKLYHSNNLHM